jgi:hypothetical protein
VNWESSAGPLRPGQRSERRGTGPAIRIAACLVAALVAIAGTGAIAPSPSSARAPVTPLSPMPSELEARFALSALPMKLRGGASVYLLDPKSGYRRARAGTSGIECLVQRTAWEMAEYRDDVYYALCYDSAGSGTYLKVIREAARMRAEGVDARDLRSRVLARYARGTYRAPARAGLSYMVAPIMRTVGPPDMKIRTMSMPHLMFYAPGVTNADIAAAPDFADPASLMNPFIDRQGNPEQSYMIQMVGKAEKDRIMAEEASLVNALCTYRDILCLHDIRH